MIKVFEDQLEKELEIAQEKLTASNVDIIYKLSGIICNMRCMEHESVHEMKEIADDAIQKYSNGRYDHNIDALYEVYIKAKRAYQSNGDQAHKDKLLEAVSRLMVEVYDMLSAMLNDSDFQEEKKEIMRRIRMIAE